MSNSCPRCDSKERHVRTEHEGIENNTVVWTVYYCTQCSYTWRDNEPDRVIVHALRPEWTKLHSLDPEDHPHNIPPADVIG